MEFHQTYFVHGYYGDIVQGLLMGKFHQILMDLLS